MKLLSSTLILILVLILLFGGFGHFAGGPYHYGGTGLSGLLILILIVLALTGRL